MKTLYSALPFVLLLATNGFASGNELTSSDQVKSAIQEICPTTGRQLGSHGTPVKVRVGEETVFLCCRGCLQAKINPTHWATIHHNFARAQRICPVMKHELPKNPKWTMINGNIVFVCCPPCTDKIEKEPAKFSKQLETLYRGSLEARSLVR